MSKIYFWIRHWVLQKCRNRVLILCQSAIAQFQYWHRRFKLGLLVLSCLSCLCLAQVSWPQIRIEPAIAIDLPALQTHRLPAALAAWQDSTQAGDYFDQVKPLEVGALIWSQFPVRVYIEAPSMAILPASASSSSVNSWQQAQATEWAKAVAGAVQEWNDYIPLQLVEQPQQADITIWRSQPPLRIDRSAAEPKPWDRNYRARSAETRYELYVDRSVQPVLLSHRCTISLRPSQTRQYIQAAARHELGHALGIWGHSPAQTDALYFSQVRNPAAISARDINTLKLIYQQPTRLGWPVSKPQPEPKR